MSIQVVYSLGSTTSERQTVDASINELASMTGRDRRTVRARLQSLTPKRGPNRSLLFNTCEALPLLFGVGTGDSDKRDPAAEKARLDAMKADIAELQRDQLRGDLVAVADVAEAWAGEIQIAKGRLLALPARLSPDMVRVTDQREAERMIRAALITILHELSGDADR